MVWAVAIDTDGRLDVIEEKPDLGRVVGGPIEAVPMSDTYYRSVMYVHEEGKIRGLPPNVIATMMVADVLAPDYVVGNAIIVGCVDPTGEHKELTDEQMTVIMVMFIGAHDYVKRKYVKNS